MRIMQTAILISILLIVFPGAACQLTSPIEQAVICSAVNQDGSPQKADDSYPPDVRTIFCSVKLRTISGSSTVKAEWYVMRSQQAYLTGYLLGSETAKAETPYLVFSFERSDKLLPTGSYQVRLSYDNQQGLSVPFTIAGDATSGETKVSEPVICSSINVSTDQPLDRIDAVPDNAGIVYCTAGITDAGFSTEVKAQWIYIQSEPPGSGARVFAQGTTRVEGRKRVSFSISPADARKLPVGSYQIKLFVNNNEKASRNFKIVDAASLPGPYLSEATVFTIRGSENKTVEVSNSFAANVEALYLRVKANNCPENTEVTVKWTALKTAQGDEVNKVISEETVKVAGTAEVLSNISRKADELPRGLYTIVLALNGTEKMTVPFQVR
jgi:hypothetical protein